MSSPNIVVEWLHSLQLGQYAESFLDNGYDDLEICKQVGEPDLDAIGVFNPNHRNRLLCSVRTLREEGAASVYFTLEESQAIQEEAKEDDIKGSQTPPVARCPFLDEYEEGKVELSRSRPVRLVHIIKEKLRLDGINLTAQPYSTSTGDRGYLEGLTARYAEAIGCRYSEVLVELEDLREREWAQLSPRFRVLTPKPPNTPLVNNGGCVNEPLLQQQQQQQLQQQHLQPPQQQGSLTRQAGLVTSLSQPIYVPGKYSPSSCLSDREEDEIYGFTGYPPRQTSTGIYGAVSGVAGGRATPAARPPPHQINKHNYQNWLSPRSAYFYEFPPSERPSKKKTTLIRLLRHLKTSRKDKNTSRANHRVLTPDEGSCSSPLEYDKMRLLQKVTRTNTFEETIHRLKVQEAMKKKEKIDREHEEPNFRQFLRDIRAGVLVGTSGTRCDDTYMYDEDSARLGQHWYDEPPYESDPEDFLMSETPPASGVAHSSRLCFTMGTRGEPMGVESEVISLRSAGDISLPHQRTLLVPGPSSSTTTTRITPRGNRESGDYAASDVNSVCSRLSSLSMETSRSEHLEMEVYHRLRPYNGIENTISPGHSSDYAEHEELMALQQHLKQCAASTSQRLRTNKCQDNGGGTGKTMGRKHHHHHHHHHHHVHHRHRAHHSSAESLPSASSTQALVSNTDDYSPQAMAAPLLARALVDSSPNLYDKEALKFKKGDIIEVLGRNSNGVGRGQVHNRVGNFRFINVELLNEPSRSPSLCSDPRRSSNSGGSYGHPRTLEQMLHAIHMEEHMSLFVLNGYEDLESFCEIREEDLDFLGLTDPEHRAKILAAVQVLQEFEQEEWNGSEAGSLIEHGKEANNLSQQTTSNQSPKDDKSSSDDTRPNFLLNIPLRPTDEPPPLPAPESNTNSSIASSTSACGGVAGVVVVKGGGGSEKSSDSGVSTSSASSSSAGGDGSRSGGGSQPSTGSAGSPSVTVRITSTRGRPPPPPSYVNQMTSSSAGVAVSAALASAGTPD